MEHGIAVVHLAVLQFQNITKQLRIEELALFFFVSGLF